MSEQGSLEKIEASLLACGISGHQREMVLEEAQKARSRFGQENTETALIRGNSAIEKLRKAGIVFNPGQTHLIITAIKRYHMAPDDLGNPIQHETTPFDDLSDTFRDEK